MKKDNFIYMHQLFSEVFKHMNTEMNMNPDCDEYRDLNVRPTDITSSKSDQKKAVFTLAEELAAACDPDTETESTETKETTESDTGFATPTP